VLQRRTFFQGKSLRGAGIKDVTWFEPSGEEMTDEHWNADDVRAFGMRLAGDEITETDERGGPIVGDSLVLFFNSHHLPVNFVLSDQPDHKYWQLVLNTAAPALPALASPDVPAAAASEHPNGSVFVVQARSLAVFRNPRHSTPVATVGEGLE